MRKLTHDEISSARLTPEQLRHADRPPLYGFLDSIRSLYNVGSMFRTSDGARIAGLFLAGFTPAPPRPEIEKTALGSTQTVPWWYYKDPLDGLAAARSRGARICILEHTTESRPYTSITPDDFPMCLVVGNEITGVSPSVLAAADCAIEIPMYGTKQSLNAAVAYGIALFELLRIWRDHSGTSHVSVK
jgi:23S rRNA (guanosine2251-2'-O)-methyltransferase